MTKVDGVAAILIVQSLGDGILQPAWPGVRTRSGCRQVFRKFSFAPARGQSMATSRPLCESVT